MTQLPTNIIETRMSKRESPRTKHSGELCCNPNLSSFRAYEEQINEAKSGPKHNTNASQVQTFCQLGDSTNNWYPNCNDLPEYVVVLFYQGPQRGKVDPKFMPIPMISKVC